MPVQLHNTGKFALIAGSVLMDISVRCNMLRVASAGLVFVHRRRPVTYAVGHLSGPRI